MSKYCPVTGLITQDLLSEYESTREQIRRLRNYTRLNEDESEELDEAQIYLCELTTEIEKREPNEYSSNSVSA